MYPKIEQVGMWTSVAYRAIHGHRRRNGMRIVCGTPIISQMIGLQHSAGSEDNIRSAKHLMERGCRKTEQAAIRFLLGVN
jgi:hypothetical protein